MRCPCGSSLAYAACCEPMHLGAAAASPEALMRSRYSAFVLNNEAYLLTSWHSRTRPAELSLDGAETWLALEVCSSKREQDLGEVHFKARYREAGAFFELEERSRFVREGEHWFYLDGEPVLTRLKPARNDPCLCHSGKKFKTCCAL